MNLPTLDEAVCYDIETYPNCFTFNMHSLNGNISATWEISHKRDDRAALMIFLGYLARKQIFMIGFNNENFDYIVVHFLFNNPFATVEQLYERAMQLINANKEEKFGFTIWPNKRFAPQIDLYKIHHFDNKAKTTSLKALQINMRSESVQDLPIAVGTMLTAEMIDHILVPYNDHDTSETKKFAWFSMKAIEFRLSLMPEHGVDVMNWNDTKIGAKILEKRLGEELCYRRDENNKKHKRQTYRTSIALKDIIFPYVYFQNPEFNRVLDYLKQQTLTSEEIKTFGQDSAPSTIKTKGVFTNLTAHVGGIDFCFGTGGMHGSVKAQRIIASDDWPIIDIDVEGLYPNLGIVNKLAPAHLGERFVEEYAKLPLERKKWQELKGKKCVEANALKLASNGTYGNTNSVFSVFYDPQYTMTVTVNGQLLLCMLVERLILIPTFNIIQINTDGITYQIHKDYVKAAEQVCKEWQQATLLKLEEARYTRMFIRDVNSYIAESKQVDKETGAVSYSYKTKGAYWSPDPLDYAESISTCQPPAWHKDLGNCVSIRAAVAAMVHNVPIEQYVRLCTNPYDFMCRIKVNKSDELLLGGQPVQKTSRYFVSNNGQELVKKSPPKGVLGTFKKKPGVSDSEFNMLSQNGTIWHEKVCTKEKTKHDIRTTTVQAGQKVTICNNVNDFNFNDINYNWYIAEAQKLIV